MVVDNQPPTAVCQNATIQLDASGNASITAAQINNGSNDNCGIASMSISPSSFTCANVGNNTVTLTVTDVNGNSASCNSTVTVQDVTPPSITSCAAPQSAFANGNCQAAVPDFTGGVAATDNCGGVTVTQSPVVGDLVGQGATTITPTVKDASNNSSQCQTTFTVTDNTPPVITNCAPASISRLQVATAKRQCLTSRLG
jgi:hypothetical protein